MNMVKKIFSLCLALTLLLSLAVPAMAEDTVDHSNHTIKINNAEPDRTYVAYQIFKGEVEYLDTDKNDETAEEKVLTSVVWGSDITYHPDGKSTLLATLQSSTLNPKSYAIYQGIQEVGTAINDEDKVTEDDVAKAVSNALSLNDSVSNALIFADIVSDYITGDGTANKANVMDPYKIEGLHDGYYLVKDKTEELNDNEVRSLFMMQLVEDSEVTPKPSSVEIIKRIAKGDDRLTYAPFTSGDVIDFVLRGTVPGRIASYSSYKYEFVDTMEEGLELVPGSIELRIYNGTDYTVVEKNETNSLYTVTEESPTGGGKRITVTIPDLKKIEENPAYSVQGGSYIVVRYKAKLNITDNQPKASLGKNSNNNSVKLRYQQDPHDSNTMVNTAENLVQVFTFGVDITKIDGARKEVLPGADFVLYRQRGGQNEYALINNHGWIYDWTKESPTSLEEKIKTETDSNEKAELQKLLDDMTVTSGTDGKITINGLAEDTYWLEETDAPEGFQKLEDPYQFQIDAIYNENVDTTDGIVMPAELTSLDLLPKGGSRVPNTQGDKAYVAVSIVNNPGHTLPETGGIGTTIFYVVGGILAAGALVLLITRKRMYE